MTLRNSLFLAALVVPQAAIAQDPTSITLFNSGRTLVRQTLPLALPAGTSVHPLSLGLFDPTSFAVLDAGVQVGRIAFDPGWSEEAILRRNIGRTFSFVRNHTDSTTITAKLVALDPERWETPRGIVFQRPGTILWPAELVPLAPVSDVAFVSDRARNSVRVMYETDGGSWQASYRLFTGQSARVEGVATIQAGPLAISDAVVQLLAGDIGYKRGGIPAPMMARAAAYEIQDMAMGAASSEAIGSARLYTLPGRATFVPGTQLVVPLFTPAAATAVRRFIVGGAISFRGGVGQMPDEQEVPVEVSWRLDRKLGTPFGDLPLPAGSVSVYDRDRAGEVQLIGMGMIGHTAPGEPLDVSTGTAFDVTARRVQTEYSVPPRPATGAQVIATLGYRVTLRNATDAAVTVEVREDRAGDWSIISSSVEPVRVSSSRVVFPVSVPARGEATITYRVRTTW